MVKKLNSLVLVILVAAVTACDGTGAMVGLHPDSAVDAGPELASCGNAICEVGEACEVCPEDCWQCDECPNSICDELEDCTTCPDDCGTCPWPDDSVGMRSVGKRPAPLASACGNNCPECGDRVCEGGEDCGNCPGDCGMCSRSNCVPDWDVCRVRHQTEFITWNLYNDAGCTSSNGVAKWYDRNNGPGALSIQDVLLEQNPAILALQEDGKLGPESCSIGNVKAKVAGWLSSTHDVRSTSDVSGSWSGERFGIFIRKSKYRFIDAGYQSCHFAGGEVRGFMWAEVDLISDHTSNHFYVLNAHFKAGSSNEAVGERVAQALCVIDWVKAKKVTNPHRAHFLLGDLNSGPDYNNDAYAMLTAPGTVGPFENTSTAGTNDLDTHDSHWIDHVLGTKNDFTRAGYASWTVGAGEVENGGALSDHLGLRTRIGHLQ